MFFIEFSQLLFFGSRNNAPNRFGCANLPRNRSVAQRRAETLCRAKSRLVIFGSH